MRLGFISLFLRQKRGEGQWGECAEILLLETAYHNKDDNIHNSEALKSKGRTNEQ